MTDKATIHMMQRMEDALRHFMEPKEFAEFTKTIAKEAFRIEMEDMADGDFKDFVMEHFDEITGTGDE